MNSSQVLCDKEMVRETAIFAIEWIKKYREAEAEKIIQAEMAERKWFGFGRNYTREEAIKNISNDAWNDYHWCHSYYSEEKSRFNKLLGAIKICTNEKDILLSIKDANLINDWRDK